MTDCYCYCHYLTFSLLAYTKYTMNDFDDPLDLLDDDGDGVIEMAILEEEEKQSKKGGNKSSSGCCFVFLILSSSVIVVGWCVSRLV